MLSSLIVIDNFFDEPEKILELSTECVYASNDNSDSYWVGKRSEDLIRKDYDTYSNVINHTVKKCIDKTWGNCDRMNIKYSWNASLFFHRMYDEPKHNDGWFHQDSSCVYAGVVYLNKNAPKQFGTTLKQEETISIDNVFNRLVLYRANIPHSANGGFGLSDDESRLTLTMFFSKLSIDIEG